MSPAADPVGLPVMVRVAGVVGLLKLAVKTPGGLPVKPLPGAAGATEIGSVFGGVENGSLVETLNVAETGVMDPGCAEMICAFGGVTMMLQQRSANTVATTGMGGAVDP